MVGYTKGKLVKMKKLFILVLIIIGSIISGCGIKDEKFTYSNIKQIEKQVNDSDLSAEEKMLFRSCIRSNNPALEGKTVSEIIAFQRHYVKVNKEAISIRPIGAMGTAVGITPGVTLWLDYRNTGTKTIVDLDYVLNVVKKGTENLVLSEQGSFRTTAHYCGYDIKTKNHYRLYGPIKLFNAPFNPGDRVNFVSLIFATRKNITGPYDINFSITGIRYDDGTRFIMNGGDNPQPINISVDSLFINEDNAN